MGHAHGQTFAYYISNTILDDTQSIFMGTPARKSLLDLATHASITRDPSGRQGLTDAQKEKVGSDEKTEEKKEKAQELRRALIEEYGQLKIAKDAEDERHREFISLQNSIKSQRKRDSDKMLYSVREQFFKEVGDRIIQANLEGKPIEYKPDTSQIQPERIALANVEFQNRDCDQVEDDELVEERIRSLEMRLEMITTVIPSALKHHIHHQVSPRTKSTESKLAGDKGLNGGQSILFTTFKAASERVSKHINPVQVLQCPECLRNPILYKAARNYVFARKDTLQRHFETHKLPHFFQPPRQCGVPGCVASFPSLVGYKRHLGDNHSIYL